MKKINFKKETINSLFDIYISKSKQNDGYVAQLHECINENIYHYGYCEFSSNDYNEICHFTGYTLTISANFFNSVNKEYFLESIRPYYLKINNKSITFKEENNYHFALLIDDEVALKLATEFGLKISLECHREKIFNSSYNRDRDDCVYPEWRKYTKSGSSEYFGLKNVEIVPDNYITK